MEQLFRSVCPSFLKYKVLNLKLSSYRYNGIKKILCQIMIHCQKNNKVEAS